MNPRTMLIVAILMLLAGAVLPFLMVIRAIPSTFALNFISYGVSVGGLFLGILGIAYYVGKQDRGNYH